MTENTSLQAKPKLTAAQVESDCPGELQDLAKHINTHLDKARKYEDRANLHTISAAQHLARAKELCDDGGFEAFRKKFCPDLGKSRLYELLSIGNEKKSIEEVRADTRARVARHRAKKGEKLEPEAQESLAETAEASVTVTDKSEPTPELSERQESPPEVAPADAPSIAPEQRPQAAAPRRPVTSKDEALFGRGPTRALESQDFSDTSPEECGYDPDLVEAPETVEENVLDTLDRHRAVARAYKKGFKVSPFDREAKKRISDAIDKTVAEWRRTQSTLTRPRRVK